MQDTARLSDHAAARIDELQAQGITLTPAEIVRLNALGWAVESPDMRMATSRGAPVFVAGVALWPRTIRACEWYCQILGKCRTVWLSRIALAYSMAHGYSAGRELERTDYAAIMRVAAWGAGLRCRMATLIEAMAQVIQQDETETKPSDDAVLPSFGEVSADVSAITGMTPEDVETGMSMHHAIRVAHRVLTLQAKATGETHHTAAYAASNRAMAMYMNEIRESRKAAK
jgi:hypothetical protein